MEEYSTVAPGEAAALLPCSRLDLLLQIVYRRAVHNPTVLEPEILRGFAEDASFAPSLSQALEEYQDNTLMAGEILATGVALSMIIIAATTTFKGKVGAIEVAKEVASPRLIESILKYFPKLI